MPVTYACGIAALAKHGILVKSSSQMELLASLRQLAVDKTGTLTAGKLSVQEVCLCTGSPDDKAAAAYWVQHGVHHLCQCGKAEAAAAARAVARCGEEREAAERELRAAHEQQMERMLLTMRTLQAECSATEARAARAALYNSPG